MFILDKPWKFLMPDEGGGGGGVDGDEGDGGGKQEQAHVPTNEGFKNFAARFSASKKAPPAEGGDPNSEQNKQVAAQMKADADRIEAEKQHKTQEAQKVGEQAAVNRPKPFIKQQIDAKRSAEQERDVLKAEKENLEKSLAEKAKIADDLQKKIDSGNFTTEQESKMQVRIEELEKASREDKESLVNENKQLKSKLSVVDLAETEEFKVMYLAPVASAHKEAVSVLGNDQKRQAAFARALSANAASMKAATEEDRATAEQERDTLLSEIVESLPQFTGSRFTHAVNTYIEKANRYADAIRHHETTAGKLRQEVQQERNKAYADRMESWGKTFKTSADNYKDDATITPEQAKAAKELGYDVELEIKKHENSASKTIAGEASMQESIDIVHKGRILPSVKAKLLISEAKVKDLEALVKKLRGAEPRGESGGRENNTQGDKQTREEWQKSKFSASRMQQK